MAQTSAATLPPNLRAIIALHVFDALGAALAGGSVAETIDVRDLIAATYGAGPALAAGTRVRTSIPAAAMLGAVAARCSEIDDIHLRACITPSSIVVPAALAVASALGAIDGPAFLAACAAGTEVLVRCGIAASGPAILYRGIWPTYLCAPFGIAAAVARLLGLDAAACADAIGIAAALAVGTTGRPPGKTSRWLTMGCAVQNGVLAAFAAARGMRGDTTLLDGKWSEITGIALDAALLVEGLGERYEIAALSLKPWCAAKQTVAATEAFATLLAGEGFQAADVVAVEVAVPAAYRAMIDQPALPANRQASFASVQYQLALAALAPGRAFDVVRAAYETSAEAARLMAATTVVADASLDPLYPAAWPARVTVTAAGGARYERLVTHPSGDPGTAMSWAEVERKLARSGVAGGSAIGAACRSLGDAPALAPLAALLESAAPA